MSGTQPCPLCQMTIPSGDGLQLHYLTSCSGYDRVAEQPRPKLEGRDPVAGGEGRTSGVGGENVASVEPTTGMGGAMPVGTPATGGGGGASVASASATAHPPEDGIVQFMWQPLTEMSYPKVTLLASFKPGSVDLSLDLTGGHYASEHVTIPKGTYEGQLVVGDSFVHPVQKFTIDSDGIVVLQFQSSHSQEDAQYGSDSYGTGYMQTNPSYNIGISGGIQDNYSQYGDYGTGGSSSKGHHRSRAGGGYDTEYREQYRTSGGLQTTDDFSYYQSYGDNSGHERRTSPVNQPPPNVSSIAQTPVMQEAATQGTYSDNFSRQLSSEGFTPEPVKSKSGAPSTVIPNNTRPTPSSLVTGFGASHHTSTSRASASHLPSQPMAQAGQRSTDASPHIAETATSAGSQNIRNNFGPPPDGVGGDGDGGGGFNVGQLHQEKEDMAVDYERQLLELKEQLETITTERDDLKQNQERVKAHLEGKIRKLEQKLQKSGPGKQPVREYDDDGMSRAQLQSAQETITQLQSELDALKGQRNVQSHAGRETRDLEKELSEVKKALNEVKDENAAMQSQLTEYAGVITDQSKMIQSGKVHDSEYVRIQQQNIHLAEYMKKQQLEFEEAINSLKKKISHTSKLGDENLKIHQLNVNLTAELEDYRTQTKRLLTDLQQKDATLAEKEAEVDQLRHQGGYYSSSSSDRDKMELDMLRQKCDAWREEVEKLAPLRDEVEHLHTHAIALEEEIKLLKADNEGLGKQLQSVTEESDRNRTETYRKAPPDYDNLRDRLTEIQQVRVQLESELIPLRQERASILTENARLREGAQPEKYTKLKEDYVALEGHYRQVQTALEEEKALVVQLQQQLSEATSSGSDKLQTIRERMERYRQERDGAKSQTDELQWQLQGATEELQRVRETSDSNSVQLQKQLTQYHLEVNALTIKAQDQEARMRRYREERNQAQIANQTFQDQISMLNKTVQTLKDELQSKNQYLNSMENSMLDSTDYPSHTHHTQSRGSSMSPSHYKETTSPTRDQQYSPHKYASGDDDQLREDMGSPTGRSVSTQKGDNRKFPAGRGQSVSSSTSSLASTGRESGKSKSHRQPSGYVAEVRTKEGTVTMYIQKPIAPLNAKDKHQVIVKRSEGDFETGTLMYIGTINQKAMAGVQLDIRMPRSSNTGSNYPKFSEGTCEADGKRYFKCSLGYGVYVPLAKIYVETHFESYTV